MLLQARDLTKTFSAPGRPVRVLEGASLEVEPGESIAVTGESGSGKSTLLHILAGLEPFDAGEVILAGVGLSAASDTVLARLRRETVAIIFQQFNLIPSLDVAANIAFQARLARRHDRALVDDLARRLGIAELTRKFPEELSGGQQQRVAIARALAARPRILLADEPTGNLDEDAADRVFEAMRELALDQGAALVVATHSERLAGRMSRRLRLSRGRLS